MNLLQAIILGIVQGLTEFIPISSTAHLVFASEWTGIYAGNPQQITATMAVIQLGTLAAVIIYFATDIWNIVTAFLRDHWNLFFNKDRIHFSDPNGGVKPRWLSPNAWLGWLVILGSVPIGVVGLVFKDFIEGEGTKNLWLIATMLIVIALVLLLAERVGSHRKQMKDLGLSDAVVVGSFQVLSLIPGASRSGSTIMGGLFAGQTRETAARFSFLLSIPAIAASGLLELREALHILPSESFLPLMVGTIVAGIVGYLSIWALLAFLRKNSMMVFIVYRLVLGSLIIVFLWRGVIEP
jgi:undecaprenyl-diphosphatase